METFTMDKAKLQELANEFAKGLKTQHDLNDFTKMLTKLAVETARSFTFGCQYVLAVRIRMDGY